jgi:hypothetical protein
LVEWVNLALNLNHSQKHLTPLNTGIYRTNYIPAKIAVMSSQI